MALTLKQLREAQKKVPPRVDEEGQILSEGPAGDVCLPASIPLQTNHNPRAGFIRLVPPIMPSALLLSPEWKSANWGTRPSAWQHIEGHPMHPEFEMNLKAAS
jgi:hypothetical protein